MAVIFGIFHMTIGIIMKGTNAIYFADYPTFFFEVVAGLVILLGLFGWMDLLIFAKWFYKIDIQDDKVVPGFGVKIETDSLAPEDQYLDGT